MKIQNHIQLNPEASGLSFLYQQKGNLALLLYFISPLCVESKLLLLVPQVFISVFTYVVSPDWSTRGSQQGEIWLPRGHLAMSGDTGDCHNLGERNATGI